MRVPFVLSAVLASAVVAFAGPPLTIPADQLKPVAGYVRFTPDTTAKSVTYVPLDEAYPFPSEELKDGRRFILPVMGLKDGRYRFVAVGTLNDEQTATPFTVVIGSPAPVVPDPDKPDPVAPVTKAENVAVVIVEESQRRTPAQGGVINSAEFERFNTDGGHVRFVVDKDDPAAKRNGYLIYAKEFPTVLVFDQKTGGKPLAVFPLPASGADLVNKVKEVVK